MGQVETVFGALSVACRRGRLVALAAALVLGAAGGTTGNAAPNAAAVVADLVQQGSKLIGGGEAGNSQTGFSVALSADGSTALLGAPADDAAKGAVWAFTRSATGWTQQGAKLTGAGETGAGEFGAGVALSADGNTALIGAPGDAGSVGAAWVFTRSGSAWSQQGSKLTGAGEVGAGEFGTDVALSADGNTALVGGDADDANKGALWVFTRSGATWTQQGAKLVGSGATGNAHLGQSVALASDGNVALGGGYADNGNRGAAWAFIRSGTTWTQQGAKLTGGGESGNGSFGFDVALSGDGNTALVGGYADDTGKGAAWVFTRSGGTWTQQGNKLSGQGASGAARFGISVALTANGSRALVGGNADDGGKGAAWVFSRAGSTWTQQGTKLTGTSTQGDSLLGQSVALTSDGRFALAGGPGDDGNKGAAWVFSELAPVVTAVVPASGPAGGGTLVKITGSNFTGATSVRFGAVESPLLKLTSETELTAVTPRGRPGAVDVTVVSPAGTSAIVAGARFTYRGAPAVTGPNPIVASILSATVTQKRGVRTLGVRVRVSVGGTARLRVLSGRAQRLQKLFVVRRGVNSLGATLARSLPRATYAVELRFADGKGHSRTVRRNVLVPARTR